MRMADLKPGWEVVGNDGGRVGTVRKVEQNYILTSRGGLANDIYVPASAVANVEHEVRALNRRVSELATRVEEAFKLHCV